MTVQQTIEQKIQAALTPSHLDVINESHMHISDHTFLIPGDQLAWSRQGHTATTMFNGEILVCGGTAAAGALPELVIP